MPITPQTRMSFNGKIVASQVADTGSIPVFRSKSTAHGRLQGRG